MLHRNICFKTVILCFSVPLFKGNLKAKTKQKLQVLVLISVSVVEGNPLKMEALSQHAMRRDVDSHSLYCGDDVSESSTSSLQQTLTQKTLVYL